MTVFGRLKPIFGRVISLSVRLMTVCFRLSSVSVRLSIVLIRLSTNIGILTRGKEKSAKEVDKSTKLCYNRKSAKLTSKHFVIMKAFFHGITCR